MCSLFLVLFVYLLPKPDPIPQVRHNLKPSLEIQLGRKHHNRISQGSAAYEPHETWKFGGHPSLNLVRSL